MLNTDIGGKQHSLFKKTHPKYDEIYYYVNAIDATQSRNIQTKIKKSLT